MKFDRKLTSYSLPVTVEVVKVQSLHGGTLAVDGSDIVVAWVTSEVRSSRSCVQTAATEKAKPVSAAAATGGRHASTEVRDLDIARSASTSRWTDYTCPHRSVR